MKKFAAVIAVMALCSAPVMAAEQGGFSGYVIISVILILVLLL